MNMQGTMKTRLLIVCVALGFFATANPLAADGPREGVEKAGTVVEYDDSCGMHLARSSRSGPQWIVKGSKKFWVCHNYYLMERQCIPPWTIQWPTKDGVVNAAEATAKGIATAAKATKDGVIDAASATGSFFKRGWERFGW